MSDDELDRLLQKAAKLGGFGPLTTAEAQAAYDAAEPVPISEDRIAEIVAYATKDRAEMSDKPTDVGAEIVRRLEEFTGNLEAGLPIEATEVQRRHEANRVERP